MGPSIVAMGRVATSFLTSQNDGNCGESCNDGDSDRKGCNDMDDNGDDNATDYDDGDCGHYYECGSGRVMR